MTYAQIKRAVLELINQYSIAGETVSPAYNNQSDYIHRIPNLINQALTRVRTETKPRRTSVRFAGGVVENGVVSYTLPEDCWHVISGGVHLIADGTVSPFREAHFLGHNTVIFPARGEDGAADTNAYLVEYHRYAEQLPAEPADDYELSEEPDVTQAALYYAAAMLVREDSAFDYAGLYNEWEARRQELRPPITVEHVPVGDVLCYIDVGWYY